MPEQQDKQLTIHDYQRALDVQSACNLTAVAHSYAGVMSKILANSKNTTEANRHPIARLYAEQISFLSGAGMGDNETYQEAFKAVTDYIEQHKG
jgi:hypothetical protein